jgi:hypothetical protein
VGIPSAWLIQGIKVWALFESPAAAESQSRHTAWWTCSAFSVNAVATTAAGPAHRHQFRRGYPTWRPGDEIFLNPTSRLRVVAVDAGTLTVERVERLDR